MSGVAGVSPFDLPIERRGTAASKWSRYPPDVLPMWVADMDFAVAPAILDALRARLEHPVFGYAAASDSLRYCIVTALDRDYGWAIAPEHIVFLPGVVAGFNMALKAMLAPGDGVVVQTPVYPPMLAAPGNWGMRRVEQPFRRDAAGRWFTDMDAFRIALREARALLLCHPHNPLGTVFDRDALAAIAAACLDAGALIVSDEIHCDLLFDGRRHVPIASLDEAVADNTITLMAASKTYNIAGLKCAFAVIRNPAIRARFEAARLGMVDSNNPFGLLATEAAYTHGGAWKRALLDYLQANRDHLGEAVRTRLPGITMQRPEGTFLAWLDCAGLGLDGPPQRFFLDRAKVAFNPGSDFGAEGRDCVRLNFGCPRHLLDEGLMRLEAALRTTPRPHA